MKFEEYYVNISHNNENISGYRDGQYAFNLLGELKPELANWIAASLKFDPFYDNNRLTIFLKFLEIVWDEPQETWADYFRMFVTDNNL